MVYNPATDFLALWRASGGTVSKLDMPALDVVVAALARAGVVNVTVSATAPLANQATTAWLKTAVPSYSAEGQFFLWDKVTTQYLAATPGLFLQFLDACGGQSGVSWWPTTGGPPLNTVGNNDDYALRTDTPGGVYGPKTAGAWPALPLPGTTNAIESTALDNTFGNTEGLMIYRDVALWEALAIGTANTLMFSNGAKPGWETLSALMDAVFSAAEGAVLYRDALLWKALPPGVANQILITGGPGVAPAWGARTAEFPSGTVMVFQQTAAPTGWTKQTALDDYGLRVTAGAVSATPGTAFSTVFAQTAVGNTTLSAAQIPAHAHTLNGNSTVYGGSGFENTNVGTNAPFQPIVGGEPIIVDNSTGGGGVHTHSISLALSYVDVIIASKN